MSISSLDIDNLAQVLHSNGDRILNGRSKLSVNASLLHQIGVKLKDLNQSDNGAFEVQQGNFVSDKNIQFLHDFFQKTSGLKVVNSANYLRPDEKVDITKFKKLKYLEVKKVPIKQMIGLKVVQHQMECIVCERGLTNLEHLLAECGGDNSTGYVWSELKEAVLSFNDIKIVDSSVAFAPWLQVLDLSHNQIFDVNAIERLPNLKYVNLSYNSLTDIPIFNKSARRKMEVLILKNNFIDDIQNLTGLDVLRELDLSSNLLCSHKSFHVLLSMSALQWLSFIGNPLCKIAKYRLNVIYNLHISASFGSFVLDGKILSKKEKENVGVELMSTSSSSLMTDFPSTSFASEDAAGPSNDTVPLISEASRPRKKSGKVRLAVIPNGDGTFDEVPPDTDVPSLKSSSTLTHLETKKIIESVRAAHGDNWLRSGLVNEMLGLPNTTLSSTPYDDSCLAALLNSSLSTRQATPSPGNIITTTAVIEPRPQHLLADEGTESFLTCHDETTKYISIEESQPPKESSPLLDTSTESEEDDEGNDCNIFLAFRVIREGSEIRKEQLFLILNDSELREKNEGGRTIESWSLKSLESVTVVKDGELQLEFETIRRDRRERCYEFDYRDFNDFYAICRSAVETRQRSLQQDVCCLACSKEFVLNKKVLNEEDATCQNCGSKLVVVLDKSSGGREWRRLSNTPAPVSNIKSHTRSASTGTAAGFPVQVSKGSSVSSLGSSGDERKQRLVGCHAVKSESDIEIISNPSMSSIEVIDANVVTPNPEPAEPEGKLPLPALAAVIFSGLTESSSSGSITDSVCTTLENSSMTSSKVSKKSITSPLPEEPAEELVPYQKTSLIESNFKSLLQDVMDRVSEKAAMSPRPRVDNDVNRITYSYTNFNELDHRIKLYVYAHLFEDSAEQFRFLLRCQILCKKDETSFNACLVFSDAKMYTLRVTDKEEGEDVAEFFQRMDNLTVPFTEFRNWRTLPWNQGFLISYRSGFDKQSQFMVLLKDGVKTLSFLTFAKKYERMFPKCDWSKSSESDWAIPVSLYLQSVGHDSSLNCLHGFLQCRMGDDETLEMTTYPDGAIIVTTTSLYIVDSLKWLLPASKPAFPSPVGCQQISDLIQASLSEKELRLHFLDESACKQEIWSLLLASEAVIESVLSDISKPWENLFSVPLEVTNIDDSF